MWSKNKAKPTKAEAAHIERIKELPCAVCDLHGPSEAHELRQGEWFTSIPLCADCHRGYNGIHGTKAIWRVKKLDELKVLNMTIRRILYGGD
jgi:hypothetical protein